MFNGTNGNNIHALAKTKLPCDLREPQSDLSSGHNDIIR